MPKKIRPTNAAGGKRHREKRPSAQFRHHQFDGEHHPADRRVEGRRNAGSGAGGNHGDALPRCHADDLPERRAERRADLDDRSFASDRRAGPNRQRGGERFDERHDWSDDTVLVVDCVHNLGHAMAASLWSKIRNEKSDEDAADDGHKDDERAPWTRRSECAGVVIERELAEKGSVVDEPDQGPEHDGAKSVNEAYDNSKKRQTNKTDLHGQLIFIRN